MSFKTAAVDASAVSGVAEVSLSNLPRTGQFSIIPGSASGTGSVEVKPSGCPGFVAVADTDGSDLEVDLSLQTTRLIDFTADALRVTSTNTADTFTLLAGS